MSQNQLSLTVREIKRLLNISQSCESARVVITPEVAKKLLENNIRNRALRNPRVEWFADQIKRGQWHVTSQSISFDKDGMLTDGQHRLHGCVLANESIETYVTFNVEASTAMDTGAKRTFSDNVSICGCCDERIEDDKIIHQVFAQVYEFKDGKMGGGAGLGRKIKPDDLVLLMNKYADQLIVCKEAGLFNNLNIKGGNNSAVKAAFFMAYINGVDLGLLQYIFQTLQTGITSNGEFDRPIVGLREKLGDLGGGARSVCFTRYCYTQCCINKVVRKLRSKTLVHEVFYTYEF